MTTKPQSTTEEPTNASGKLLFPERLTMVACDQCNEAQPWPLRCGHTYVGIHSREYTRISPASTAPVVDDGLRIAINSCRDVTTLGRFAPAVDPVRWVAQLQAHLESLLNSRAATSSDDGLVAEMEATASQLVSQWRGESGDDQELITEIAVALTAAYMLAETNAAAATAAVDLEKCMAEPKSDTELICVNCGREVVMSEYGPPINDICWSHIHNGVVWCNWPTTAAPQCSVCGHESLFSDEGQTTCKKPVRTEAAKNKSTAETHADDFTACGCKCVFSTAASAEQSSDLDEATMDWALSELADGWIQNNEREGPHGFYQNARRVLNAIVKRT